MFVVHAGLPKSGSATIQTFLTVNEIALRNLSVDYVEIGRHMKRLAKVRLISAHHNFPNELRGRKTLFFPEIGSISDLAEYAGRATHEIMIVSSEMFEGCTAAQISEFKDTMSTSGQSFRIILFIRDLCNLLPSSYAQKIRRGLNLYNFDKFFDDRVGGERVRYFDTANRWAQSFGWENMRIRLLDSGQLVNGDLIDDFLTAIGVDSDTPEIRSLPRQERVNEASGWKTLEATRALFAGRHGLERDHPLSLFATGGAGGRDDKALRKADGKRFEKVAMEVAEHWGWRDKGRYLTRLQAQHCLNIYETSLRQLSEKLPRQLPPALDLGARGFVEREFLPDATHIAPDELRTFYDDVWSEMVNRNELASVAKKERKSAKMRR